MNAVDTSSGIAPRQPRHTVRWILLGILCLFVFVTVRVVGCFMISSDTAALRNELVQSAPAEWHKRIELSVGSMALSMARFIIGFLEVPPEARTALQALRGGEVAIYEVDPGDNGPEYHSLLASADRAMLARGWERVVGCVQHKSAVAVYVPQNIRSPKRVQVCVAVVNPRQMVLVSARGNLEPLLELARAAYENAKDGSGALWPHKREHQPNDGHHDATQEQPHRFVRGVAGEEFRDLRSK